MGVRGLTTFINNNQDVYMKEHYLHNTNLIIDGLSLSAQLYRSLNCFSAFGGDYDKYALFVKNFFKNLRKCNIVPYVVFDGSYEKKKLKTVYNRLRSKLKSSVRLDPVTQGSLQFFPLLLRDVFKEVLEDMNVSYTVCEFEADDEIASLARHLNCPVLSYDSDFFIYNVLYVPFNTISLKTKLIDESGQKLHAIECKIYKVDYLIEHFGGLNKDLLPLLAILLGNDYVEKRVFNKFFSQLKLLKSKKKYNDQQRSINTLFTWLQNETLDTAVSKILGRLKNHQRDKVLDIIKKGIEGYNNKRCQSISFLNLTDQVTNKKIIHDLSQVDTDVALADDFHDVSAHSDDDEPPDHDSDTSPEAIEESSDDEPENESLPEWVVLKIRHNEIPSQYLNLYSHHMHFCNPQAEDYMDEDSFLCALPIMRYAFDLLTDFSQEHCIYVCRENATNYKKMLIGSEYSSPKLHDKQFSVQSTDELKSSFHAFLKHNMPSLDLRQISLLPSNLQLIMIAILWWIKNCNVPVNHVHSIIMSYITLDVIDEKTGHARGHFLFNNKHRKKIEDWQKTLSNMTIEDELYLNKNKVQYEDCVIAASVLLKHFEIDETIRKKPKSYDTKKMHSFAQFQCILQQMNCLNVLCGMPFEKTSYSKSFNGTFVYNIALKLENQIDPESFLKQYLKGATSLLAFYKSVSIVLNNLMTAMNVSLVKWSKRKRSRRKKNVEDEFLNIKEFESEVII